jgi:aminoglycoside N3'-acetyltransferase
MPATRSSLHADFQRIGVRQGDVLMIHASVRAVGAVTGGANVIVQALFDAIGPEWNSSILEIIWMCSKPRQTNAPLHSSLDIRRLT